jgi:tetratricopeptide (TPR) repeat protein
MANDPQELDAEELLALAKHELQRGELEDALGKLKRLVSRKQPPDDAHAVIARAYAQLGLMDRAQGAFKKYLEQHPDSAHETFELGVTYFDQGKNDKAMEYWQRVLKLQPTHPPALFFSAAAMSRTGQTADARRQLDVLFKSAPADNLYAERGRDLLKALESEPPPGAGAQQPAPATPYRGH